MLGRPSVMFTCSGHMSYHSFAKLLKGVAATGAWLCLHAFDRLSAGVMSSVAELVSSLMRAVVLEQQKFRFFGMCDSDAGVYARPLLAAVMADW